MSASPDPARRAAPAPPAPPAPTTSAPLPAGGLPAAASAPSGGGTGRGAPLALFDLDGTLVDRATAFRGWADAFARRHGIGPEGAAWLVREEDDGFRDRTDLFARLRERFDVRVPVAGLVRLYQRQFPGCFRPDPRVRGALGELRAAGWRIGIVTNGRTAGQLEKIHRARLAECVDGVAVSEGEGVAKPDPEIFTRAAAACGAALGPAGWMVGDTAGADVLGGRRAGLRTLWMRRGREWPGTAGGTGGGTPAPDAQADSIPEAVRTLLASVRS